VTQHRDLLHAEMIQQRRGVGGQQLETVMDIGLGRLAPADLVRGDHPVPGPGQRLDHIAEVVAAERLPVEQDDRLSVRLRVRRDIPVPHRDRLQVTAERQELDRIGTLVLLQANT
jgi:hypothetical protein